MPDEEARLLGERPPRKERRACFTWQWLRIAEKGHVICGQGGQTSFFCPGRREGRNRRVLVEHASRSRLTNQGRETPREKTRQGAASFFKGEGGGRDFYHRGRKVLESYPRKGGDRLVQVMGSDKLGEARRESSSL